MGCSALTADRLPRTVCCGQAARHWFDSIRGRPGTQRAYDKGEPYISRPAVTEEGKKVLFGQTASSTRL